MTGAGRDPRLARLLAMEQAMHAAAAATVCDGPWGRAYLQPARPAVHAENFVWASPGARAAELERATASLLAQDEVITLEHDEPVPGLLTAGFEVRGEWLMALDAAPDRVDDAGTTEVGIEALLPSIDRWLATDPDTAYAREAGVRAQLVEHHRHFGSAGAHERCFAVVRDGTPQAWAKLWLRDGVAQVEDVAVLPEARGRGWGRGVVTAAVRAAEAAGAEVVTIVAEEADWPKALYARLGFRRIGTVRVLTRR